MKKISVTDLVKYLKYKNDQDSNLFNLTVSGELSNVKVYPSKHIYFDLKDDNAKINGVMFASSSSSLAFKPQDGDQVKVIGSVKVYQNNATFQVIATKIEKDGYGDLFIQFEQNKKELEKAGYFDVEHKKAIPMISNKIAVISGHNSAALKDVLTTLNSRFKLSQIVVFECLVQGKDAPKKLIETIEIVNKYDFDVIILARGGGSFEDLNAFNDMKLGLTIFNSRIPIVTGIGHETDYTIADFISDYRAVTPTAAAMKVSPDSNELKRQVEKNRNTINNLFKNIINDNYQVLDSEYKLLNNLMLNKINILKNKLSEKRLLLEKNNIRYKIQNYQQKTYEYHMILNNLMKYNLTTKQQLVKENQYQLTNIFEKIIQNKKQKLNESIIRLNLLDPNLALDKGYAIVYRKTKLIKDYSQLEKSDSIKIVGKKATVQAIVEEVNTNGK